jgi:hypothetical protein
MASDRLMIWKFDAAPAALRLLREGSETPSWVALVPKAIHTADLDEAILAQTGPGGASRFAIDNGDVVYIGSCDVQAVLAAVAAESLEGTQAIVLQPNGPAQKEPPFTDKEKSS